MQEDRTVRTVADLQTLGEAALLEAGPLEVHPLEVHLGAEHQAKVAHTAAVLQVHLGDHLQVVQQILDRLEALRRRRRLREADKHRVPTTVAVPPFQVRKCLHRCKAQTKRNMRTKLMHLKRVAHLRLRRLEVHPAQLDQHHPRQREVRPVLAEDHPRRLQLLLVPLSEVVLDNTLAPRVALVLVLQLSQPEVLRQEDPLVQAALVERTRKEVPEHRRLPPQEATQQADHTVPVHREVAHHRAPRQPIHKGAKHRPLPHHQLEVDLLEDLHPEVDLLEDHTILLAPQVETLPHSLFPLQAHHRRIRKEDQDRHHPHRLRPEVDLLEDLYPEVDLLEDLHPEVDLLEDHTVLLALQEEAQPHSLLLLQARHRHIRKEGQDRHHRHRHLPEVDLLEDHTVHRVLLQEEQNRSLLLHQVPHRVILKGDQELRRVLASPPVRTALVNHRHPQEVVLPVLAAAVQLLVTETLRKRAKPHPSGFGTTPASLLGGNPTDITKEESGQYPSPHHEESGEIQPLPVAPRVPPTAQKPPLSGQYEVHNEVTDGEEPHVPEESKPSPPKASVPYEEEKSVQPSPHLSEEEEEHDLNRNEGKTAEYEEETNVEPPKESGATYSQGVSAPSSSSAQGQSSSYTGGQPATGTSSSSSQKGQYSGTEATSEGSNNYETTKTEPSVPGSTSVGIGPRPGPISKPLRPVSIPYQPRPQVQTNNYVPQGGYQPGPQGGYQARPSGGYQTGPAIKLLNSQLVNLVAAVVTGFHALAASAHLSTSTRAQLPNPLVDRLAAMLQLLCLITVEEVVAIAAVVAPAVVECSQRNRAPVSETQEVRKLAIANRFLRPQSVIINESWLMCVDRREPKMHKSVNAVVNSSTVAMEGHRLSTILASAACIATIMVCAVVIPKLFIEINQLYESVLDEVNLFKYETDSAWIELMEIQNSFSPSRPSKPVANPIMVAVKRNKREAGLPEYCNCGVIPTCPPGPPGPPGEPGMDGG
ncbi:hypothetical protein QR680_003249 [Steinernema hermaphroditum]|uniref:Nematode cuticle collagen N-terminal domain-containing protein n=1 Tax=Steinernema hermaphroditum TaxID=289476 RepID=A0AA39H5Y8_9BILA|nr:hypothetical protein QR680_003249 [Steinernema hermaphroditum]